MDCLVSKEVQCPHCWEKFTVEVDTTQGNYETVDVFPGDVFLILRAKCETIARHMGVNFGQVALISTRVRNAGSGTHPAL